MDQKEDFKIEGTPRLGNFEEKNTRLLLKDIPLVKETKKEKNSHIIRDTPVHVNSL